MALCGVLCRVDEVGGGGMRPRPNCSPPQTKSYPLPRPFENAHPTHCRRRFWRRSSRAASACRAPRATSSSPSLRRWVMGEYIIHKLRASSFGPIDWLGGLPCCPPRGSTLGFVHAHHDGDPRKELTPYTCPFPNNSKTPPPELTPYAYPSPTTIINPHRRSAWSSSPPSPCSRRRCSTPSSARPAPPSTTSKSVGGFYGRVDTDISGWVVGGGLWGGRALRVGPPRPTYCRHMHLYVLA